MVSDQSLECAKLGIQKVHGTLTKLVSILMNLRDIIYSYSYSQCYVKTSNYKYRITRTKLASVFLIYVLVIFKFNI